MVDADSIDAHIGAKELLWAPVIAGSAAARESVRRIGEAVSGGRAEQKRPDHSWCDNCACRLRSYLAHFSPMPPFACLLARRRYSHAGRRGICSSHYLFPALCPVVAGDFWEGSGRARKWREYAASAITSNQTLGETESLIVISCVAALFGLFLLLQLSHLLGVAAAISALASLTLTALTRDW